MLPGGFQPREREEQRGRVSAEHPTSSHLNRVGWEQVLTARDVNKAIGVPEVESLARELAAQANQGDRAVCTLPHSFSSFA